MRVAMTDDISVEIVLNETGNPPGKLADAELHFTGGDLEGLCFVGFGVWQKRERPAELSITVPSRKFLSQGESRTFKLVRISDPNQPPEDAPRAVKQSYYQPLDRMRRIIGEAYTRAVSEPVGVVDAPDDVDDELGF